MEEEPVHNQAGKASSQRAVVSSELVRESQDLKGFETTSFSGSVHSPGKPLVFLTSSDKPRQAIHDFFDTRNLNSALASFLETHFASFSQN